MSPSILELARTQWREGHLESALGHFDAIETRSPEVEWERIRLLVALKRVPDAIAAIEKRLTAFPDDAALLNGLGVLKARSDGATDAAVKPLEKALSRAGLTSNVVARIRANLGVFYLERNDPARAAEHLNASLDSSTDVLRSHFLLAMNASGAKRLPISNIITVVEELILHPHLNFDVSQEEPRWRLKVNQQKSDKRFLRVLCPRPEEEVECRLTVGTRFIAGIGMSDAYYGLPLRVTERSETELTFDLWAEKNATFIRVQTRDNVRVSGFNPLAELRYQSGTQKVVADPKEYALLDISATGMRVKTQLKWALEQALQVSVNLPDGPLQFDAQVMRAEKGNVYGIKFAITSERVVERLHRAIFKFHMEQVSKSVRAS